MKLINRSIPGHPVPVPPPIPVEDAAEHLPYIVRRDAKLAAAFARKEQAIEWAEMRSYNDESGFTVHTATAVLAVYRDGEDVRR